jgi:hypothetical protein
MEAQGAIAFKTQVGELGSIWGKKTQPKKIRWPLHFRIGKIS